MAHDHGHSHAADPTDLGPAFRLAVVLNAGYVAAEAAAGFLTGSLALLADAAHNLTDVAGLLIAWAAAVLARRAATARHSWGLGRATILAALLNGIAILIGVFWVLWEAVGRLYAPVEVPGPVVMAVAGIGIAINTGTALLFLRARHDDLNAEGAFLHMAADAAVSVAVVLAAAGIWLSGWLWLDPAVAIAVSLLIAVTAWRLTRQALHLGLDGVPEGIDPEAVARELAAEPGVAEVHDLHIWALSTTRTALAAHVVHEVEDPDALIDRLAHRVEHAFGIGHVTLQLERRRCGRAHDCRG
jgi:cobalt-zinc-cadmium efflux system protein